MDKKKLNDKMTSNASYSTRAQIVEWINQGADVNYNNGGYLHLLSCHDRWDIIMFLIENHGADIEPCARNMFINAAYTGNIQMMEYIRKNTNLDIEEVKDDAFITSLNKADLKAVQFIVENYGADIYVHNNNAFDLVKEKRFDSNIANYLYALKALDSKYEIITDKRPPNDEKPLKMLKIKAITYMISPTVALLLSEHFAEAVTAGLLTEQTLKSNALPYVSTEHALARTGQLKKIFNLNLWTNKDITPLENILKALSPQNKKQVRNHFNNIRTHAVFVSSLSNNAPPTKPNIRRRGVKPAKKAHKR